MTRSREEIEDLARLIWDLRQGAIYGDPEAGEYAGESYDAIDPSTRSVYNEIARGVFQEGYKPPPKATTPEDIKKAFQAVRSTQDILLGRDKVGYFEDAEADARVYEPEDSEY